MKARQLTNFIWQHVMASYGLLLAIQTNDLFEACFSHFIDQNARTVLQHCWLVLTVYCHHTLASRSTCCSCFHSLLLHQISDSRVVPWYSVSPQGLLSSTRWGTPNISCFHLHFEIYLCLPNSCLRVIIQAEVEHLYCSCWCLTW